MKKHLPMLESRAAFSPSTLNDEKRTVEMIWTTGQRGKRSGFFTGPYYEELGMKAKEIRMERAKSGIPFLDSHISWEGNDRNLGIVEDIRFEKNADGDRVGIARVRFDTHDLAERRFQSVRNGILRDVSVGYRVHRYEKVEDVQENGETVPVLRATDWEPFEVSLVSMGFDTKAKIRGHGEEITNECTVSGTMGVSEQNEDPQTRSDKTEGSEVTIENKPAPHAEPKIDESAVREAAVNAERQRVSAITSDCERVGMSDLAREFIEKGTQLDDVRAALLEKVAERQAKPTAVTEVTRDESETRNAGIIQAVCHRALPHRFDLDDNGKRFRQYSLVDIARELTGKRGSAVEIVTDALTNRAYQTTSSFTNILEDIQNKTLRAEYDANVGSFEPFIRRSTLNDFRETSRARLGDMGDLVEMPEGGEFTTTEASDSTEKIQLKTYGRRIGLSRQAIINDDLDAFSRFPSQFAVKARNLEANLVYGVINTNANMSDGNALFSSDHGNLAAAAAAISVAALGAGLQAMRLQTTENGMPINIMPTYLVVPPQLETVALQYVAQNQPDASSNVNPFVGRLTVIVDPRLYSLTSGSATAWYLFAMPSQIDTIELASLAGGESVNLDRKEDVNTLGVWWDAYIDRGVKAIDWRGVYKNAGA